MHYNCLIVDDEVELAKMTAEYFEMFNVKTQYVESAVSCFDFLKENDTDLILLDISDSRWHIGLDGVKKMTDAYPETPLLPIHWGCVDAPEWREFNGDPEVVKGMIVNPDRLFVKAVGEPFVLPVEK